MDEILDDMREAILRAIQHAERELRTYAPREERIETIGQAIQATLEGDWGLDG